MATAPFRLTLVGLKTPKVGVANWTIHPDFHENLVKALGHKLSQVQQFPKNERSLPFLEPGGSCMRFSFRLKQVVLGTHLYTRGRGGGGGGEHVQGTRYCVYRQQHDMQFKNIYYPKYTYVLKLFTHNIFITYLPTWLA